MDEVQMDGVPMDKAKLQRPICLLRPHPSSLFPYPVPLPPPFAAATPSFTQQAESLAELGHGASDEPFAGAGIFRLLCDQFQQLWLEADGGNPASLESGPPMLSIGDGNVADAPVPPEEALRMVPFTPTKGAASRRRSPALQTSRLQ